VTPVKPKMVEPIVMLNHFRFTGVTGMVLSGPREPLDGDAMQNWRHLVNTVDLCGSDVGYCYHCYSNLY